jgi:hypothetical protein
VIKADAAEVVAELMQLLAAHRTWERFSLRERLPAPMVQIRLGGLRRRIAGTRHCQL